MRRFIFYSGIVAATLWLLALSIVLSPRTTQVVKPWLEAKLCAAMGHVTTIDRIELGLVPPQATAWGLSIGESEEELCIRARKIQVQPSLWRTFAGLGRPVLHQVSIEGLAGHLKTTAKGGGNSGAAKEFAPSWPLTRPLPLDVAELIIADADWVVETHDLHGAVLGMSLRVSPYSFGKRKLLFDAASTQVLAPKLLGNKPLAIRLQAAAILEGHLHLPERILVQQAPISCNGVAVMLQGEIDVNGQHPDSRLQATLDAPLQHLAQAFGRATGQNGTLQLQGSLANPFVEPKLQLQGTIAHWTGPAGAADGEVSFEALLTPHHAALTNLRIVAQKQTTVVVQGGVDFAANRPFWLETQLLRAQLLPLLRPFAAHNVPWDATISGRIRAQGSLQPALRVESLWDVAAEPLVLMGKDNKQGTKHILHIAAVQMSGTTVSDTQQTQTDGLRLQLQSSQLLIKGKLTHTDAVPTLRLDVSAKNFQLAHLGAIANTPYLGLATLQGVVTGPIARPSFQATADVQQLNIGPVSLGNCSGELGFAAPKLVVAHLVDHVAHGTLQGDVALNFTSSGLQLETNLEAQGIELRPLMAVLRLPRALGEQLQGAVFGTVRTSGPLLWPRGTADLATPDLGILGAKLGPGALMVRFGEENRRIALQVEADPMGGHFKGHLDWHRDGALTFDVTGRKLPLQLMPTLDRAGMTGLASIEMNVEGPTHHMVGGATFNVDDVEVAGRSQGGVHVVARLQGDKLQSSFSMLRGGLHADGSWRLTEGLPGHIKGGLDALNLANYLPLFVPHQQPDKKVFNSVITGSWDVRGAFARPQGLWANFDLQGLQLDWRGTNLRLKKPARIEVAHGMAVLSDLVLQGPLMLLSLSGRVPLQADDGRLDVSARAKGDLSAVAGLSQHIDAGKGPFWAQATFGGMPKNPDIVGDAKIHRGMLRIRGQQRPLEHIEGRMVFNGRTAAITKARATLGEGRLTLAGEANMGSGSWDDPQGLLSLRLRLQRVPIKPNQDTDAMVSGALEYVSGPSGPLLRGDVGLDALRYTARIDLDKLVPKRAAPPLRAPGMPVGQATKLLVHVKAPGNVLISSPVLEAELAADLNVTGSTDRVGLIGSVTPLWARAKWHDNLYVLTRSSIDFVDEYRIAPQFDVVAKTRACQMDADVQIQGSIDGFTVTPSGRDERGPVAAQDVLTCLQFGLRLRDFNGNQKTGATAGAVSSGLDALWTVSGLDAKVRKFLPITVDELRLTSAWSSNAQRTTPRVLVAKELGHHISLRYQRSIDEYNDQAFSLDYNLARHAALSAGWLTARDVDIGDFGLDLRLHWSLR